MTTRSAPNRDYTPIWEVIPFTATSSAQDLTLKDCFLVEIQVSVPSTAGSPVHVVVADKQGTPVAAYDSSVQPGEYFSLPFNDRPMTGGITVLGNGASIYVRWKQ